MRIGILFGGKSREREISFAGGRTVYDLLDKSLFQPVPLFIDSLGNIIRLQWPFLYKGTIRDFYPPSTALPSEAEQYQLYMENLLPLAPEEQDEIIRSVGEKVRPDDLSAIIDFAFLALHGSYGEDGSIQGLLHFYDIPYSGSGILPSAIGISKAIQKRLMNRMGLRTAEAVYISRKNWESAEGKQKAYAQVKQEMSLPIVIKAATQGSSIGISVLHEWDEQAFEEQVSRAFFKARISADEWTGKSKEEKVLFLRRFTDIYEGIGLPARTGDQVIYRPDRLQDLLDRHFAQSKEDIAFESLYTESGVLVERFIKGREFSCIVVEDQNGQPLALPPTEIVKRTDIFDYRAKYLPGISRKITPIDLPKAKVEAIAQACEALYADLEFDVYARIDGILSEEGEIFLNDPNTTSGMLPSSFFFHQAAEIGLSPGEFLTYIIHTSLQNRAQDLAQSHKILGLKNTLEEQLRERQQEATEKQRIGVVLGRHLQRTAYFARKWKKRI